MDQAFRNTGMMINTASLTLVRWIAMSGQLATIFIVHIGLGFPLPLEACRAHSDLGDSWAVAGGECP